MKAFQYRDRGGRVRLAVLTEHDSRALDVSEQVGGAGDLVAAIGRARTEGRSVRQFMADASSKSTRALDVDLDAGTVGRDQGHTITLPVCAPEVWAAGVSYLRSRAARESESSDAEIFYTKVYSAERPELFLKDSGCRRTVAHGEAISIRGDSVWSVPEAELALVLSCEGTIVGYSAANDVTARDIEAENPLYLPQAKIFAGACAVGPTILLVDDITPAEFQLKMQVIDKSGQVISEGSSSTALMKRSSTELVEFLFRYNRIDDGTVLMTGTGIVPDDSFRLSEGQTVEIAVSDIGVLRNPVTLATGQLQRGR